jgi:uncharacterized RDD family membrane protein YckC
LPSSSSARSWDGCFSAASDLDMRELQALSVLTPEHVRINLVAAGLGRRLCAFILDFLFCMVIITACGILFALLPESLGILLQTTGSFLIFWGYHVYFEVAHAGRSPGKRFLRLRVSDARGLPINIHQSMARNAARALDFIPAGGIGLLACLLDPYRRRIGDRLADTLVISETIMDRRAVRPLERTNVNSLDTPRLRRAVANRLSLEEREFLLSLCLRSSTLTEIVRYDLFEAVARRYRQRFQIEDEHLSGEKLVRNLLALCHRRE